MNSPRITGRTFAANALLLLTLVFAGCARERAGQSQPCYVSAKDLFERASRDYHIPSAQARGVERTRLETRAADLYREIVRDHSAEPYWAAQASRSLANIYAAQTNITAAVEWYSAVGERYPRQDFEVLMAWKSAADLLWDAGRSDEAKEFYRQIIARYDTAAAVHIIKTVVRGSRARLQST